MNGPVFKTFFMNVLSDHKLVVAGERLKDAIVSLLVKHDLPTSDLDESKTLFACLINEELVGAGGLEFFTDCALLRSVCVRTDMQRSGLGTFIVRELEKVAVQHGVHSLYLLTTTAKDFFTKEGYRVVDRMAAPIDIKNTTQFSSVCPSTAIVMGKFVS